MQCQRLCWTWAIIPFIGVHVTAESSQWEEGRRALRVVVLLQETLDIQPEVISPRKVVRIGTHSAYYLKRAIDKCRSSEFCQIKS